jgi:localization factor PodJL
MRATGPRFSEIRPEDREILEAAARRAGLSVSDWLDTVIMKAATEADEPPTPKASEKRENENADPFAITSLHRRLDSIAEQMDALAKQMDVSQHLTSFRAPVESVRLETALNRLAAKLDRYAIDAATHAEVGQAPKPNFFSRLRSN